MAALGTVGLSVLIFLYYEFRLFQIKDPKSKYDFVGANEIRYFWYSVLALIIAVALFINSINTPAITGKSLLWFYVRLFATASFLVISYFIFFGMVRIYYPKSVNKRMTRLRARPRLSPAGNVMRLLPEHEEDSHLERSQITEESVHSVDYDVWIDDKTGFKKIEKYMVTQTAEECPACGYFTLVVAREELKQAPTMDSGGAMIRHLECKYCEHKEGREVGVAPLAENV
jgi:hypothetical protein